MKLILYIDLNISTLWENLKKGRFTMKSNVYIFNIEVIIHIITYLLYNGFAS
jgi:hypothetical protein